MYVCGLCWVEKARRDAVLAKTSSREKRVRDCAHCDQLLKCSELAGESLACMRNNSSRAHQIYRREGTPQVTMESSRDILQRPRPGKARRLASAQCKPVDRPRQETSVWAQRPLWKVGGHELRIAAYSQPTKVQSELFYAPHSWLAQTDKLKISSVFAHMSTRTINCSALVGSQ